MACRTGATFFQYWALLWLAMFVFGLCAFVFLALLGPAIGGLVRQRPTPLGCWVRPGHARACGDAQHAFLRHRFPPSVQAHLVFLILNLTSSTGILPFEYMNPFFKVRWWTGVWQSGDFGLLQPPSPL